MLGDPPTNFLHLLLAQRSDVIDNIRIVRIDAFPKLLRDVETLSRAELHQFVQNRLVHRVTFIAIAQDSHWSSQAQRSAPSPQRLQFARQRIGPLRDRAGAEADHVVARLGQSP